ncbi:MAG: acyltransferase [Gammaproteobacteria bacterium]|nr:acyltransferase [Gammaproteobacteria bacterium]
MKSDLPNNTLRARSKVWRVFNIIFWVDSLYSAFIKLRLKKCGRGVKFRLSTVIKGHENIVLGDNFSSMGVLYIYANDDGYLEVGNNCVVNTNVQLGASGGKLIIGDNVMIGPNVVIRATNHGTRKGAFMNAQPHSYGEINVEDDVWIGSNSVITSGVTLAKGTVVGAGAVVTKSTEPYSIVGGVPARKIGERI